MSLQIKIPKITRLLLFKIMIDFFIKYNNYADIIDSSMKKHIIAFLLLTCITGINAQDNRLFIKDLDLKVYISLENEHYRIGEDIYLYVEIVNQSDDPVEFDTSPYKLNNTKLFVKNLQTGELLEERYSKIVENNNLKKERPELFKLKKTVLYTDEILKFKINLPEYFEFDKFGRYKITIKFDPFPAYTIKHKNFTSNPLYLALKDRLIDEEYKELVKLLNEIEEQKRYTPKGTIEFILNSYIKEDWFTDTDRVTFTGFFETKTTSSKRKKLGFG